MIWFLRLLFCVVLASMLTVTSWASLHCPLLAIPADVRTHPWFIATLADAYWGFVTFYVWLAWKEPDVTGRCLWLVAVLALGNIAMSAYVLRELFAASPGEDLARVLTRRHPRRLVLPGVLVAASAAVYALA